MSVATETLTGRDRAILRAVAAGHAELGAGSVLYVDGRYCSDQIAAWRLTAAGLIRAAEGATGERVPAVLVGSFS
ncbi:hypothetical protein SAMN05443637_10962 [Pseudonocardia thermophila]|jgi:hypothetical protein|uniref:Uncharacterized protein n=1 Tax=Pseudonocardia thermophila TaxID=1848 RepID=A0A1M6U0N2_PSETH|nr:hypothetical protein [Pseudonocardia thermophila]SHK62766.1 hypothetical protein SAMN05443637_10962 [Pseudonocardia thermophila]